MFATLLKLVMCAAFVGSLFSCSPHGCVALLLVAWAVAIGIFVYLKIEERHVWIPAALAFAGLLGSLFVLAIPTKTTLAVNGATLIMFAISLEASSSVPMFNGDRQ